MWVNPATAQARVLADELVRAGLRHIVVCPGSRNAPLSMAFHELAAAGRLTMHVRVDERSAGFLALALSRVGGLAAVLCTSGTAVANLHPAVLEAQQSRVPVLVLTADRPAELHGTGANQTIAQRGLFGAAAECVELPVAQRQVGAVAVWRGTVCRAVALSRTGGVDRAAGGLAEAASDGGRRWVGGPVQVNVPFAEPLVPDGDVEWPESLDGRPDGRPWTVVEAGGAVTPGAAAKVRFGARTVVVVGDDRADRIAGVVQIAAAAGWPVIAEPTGVGAVCAALGGGNVAMVTGAAGTGLRAAAGGGDEAIVTEGVAGSAADGHMGLGGGVLLGSGSLLINAGELAAELRPDEVVVVGRPTLSRGVGRLLRYARTVTVVGEEGRWTDPQHLAALATPWLRPADVTLSGQDPDWLPAWQRADRATRTAADKTLADLAWPTGLAVAGELLDAMPAGAALFVGSSNPIRFVDFAGRVRPDVLVVANRGVAGIDGSVSSAVGVALGSGRPGYALLGDLTFLHDVNGLLIGPDEPRPDLVIVVLNDDGGGIFSLLEQGAPEHADSFERVFGTPHGADIGALCAGYRVPHTLVTTADEFRAAVRATAAGGGIRVVEVRTERAELRDWHATLRANVHAAVSAAI